MQDTPEDIQQLQRSIFARKTNTERFMIGMELMEQTRNQIVANIRQMTPDVSELDLKIELFKRLYSQDFDQGEMIKIIQSMIEYHKLRV